MEAGSDVGGSCVPRESRRRKTVWQAWQKKALLSAFTKNQYPSFRDRQDLARQIELPESRIRVWFQNRRSRTGQVGHAPKRSTRGGSLQASLQLQEDFGFRAQCRGMLTDCRRPRTRLTSAQHRILVQAFERNPRPGFASRAELAQWTGLPEDTIHIWFQNRRARLTRTRRPTAHDQDLLPSQGQHGVPAGLSGREPAAAEDILLPLAVTGGAVMENSIPRERPNFNKDSKQPQLAQPSGAGQESTPIPVSSKGPQELLLDQLLDENQGEDHQPVLPDLDVGPGESEHEGAQEIFMPLAAPDFVGMETSCSSKLSTFYRESQPPPLAQHSGAGQAHTPTQSSSTGTVEHFLDQLLTEVQLEKQAPGPVDLEDAGQQMDTIPELPLTQEEYEDLLHML